MSRTIKLILAVNLIAIAALSFIYPNLMVGPGKLIVGHEKLETDCFACHRPFGGAHFERCVACHQVADIGRVTTTGQAIVKPTATQPFHQNIIKQDCISCHSDHAGVKRYRPQGRFNHSLLQANMRSQCQNCHHSPDDSLHRKITGNCSQCHTQKKWVPATFDHDRYFILDRDHDKDCATCHLRSDYSRYTCYGCHEHTPKNIRHEHIEEGIRDFKNCIECHRSADEDDIRKRSMTMDRRRQFIREGQDDQD